MKADRNGNLAVINVSRARRKAILKTYSVCSDRHSSDQNGIMHPAIIHEASRFEAYRRHIVISLFDFPAVRQGWWRIIIILIPADHCRSGIYSRIAAPITAITYNTYSKRQSRGAYALFCTVVNEAVFAPYDIRKIVIGFFNFKA